jgi:hypothetical protein
MAQRCGRPQLGGQWQRSVLTFDAGPADDLTHRDVYLFDRQTNQATKISVTPAGEDADNGSGGSSLSHSGNHVAFGSNATTLAPGDDYGNFDVFVWSRTIG